MDPTSAEPTPPVRRRWTIALIGVAVLAAVALWAARTGPEEPAPDASPTVTTLHAPEASAARCMVPTAERLGQAEVAFRGTVTELSGDTVTLEPTRWYAGEETDQVQVSAPAAELSRLLESVTFTQGGDYLVAATDGAVLICGYSGRAADPLAALYDEAFPAAG